MKTIVVIPSRYEKARLRELLKVIVPDIDLCIVLDNGHEPPFLATVPKVEVVKTDGPGIYHWWNQGWRLARDAAAGEPFNLAILNDDIRILPETLSLLATALRSEDDIGAVYPDRRVRLAAGLPDRLDLTTDRDPVGARELTGYCFMFRGELPLPPFDEGYHWWYGDTQFDESVRLAGYGVSQVNGLPIEHISDAESDDWARRPELKGLVEADAVRWASLHAEISDGRWGPASGDAPKVVLLVPRRLDHGPRDRIWEWCRARWEREFPDIPIYEGHHDDGPFNRSAAINTAALLAGDWDLGIVIDSDVFLRVSQVRDAIARATQTGKVTWAHRRWRGLSEEQTARVVDQKRPVDFGPQFQRHDMDLYVEVTRPLSWSCCIVIPRKVWDDLGGFDERFRGWGFEDMAFQSAVCGLYGHERIEGDVYHLWHPRSEERIVTGESRMTASPEYVTNARLGRRYMVAVRRDHGQTDHYTPFDAARLAEDIDNLKRDDAKFAPVARKLRLPDWDQWWPTLEELRDGARTARFGTAPTITVIVRTGGDPDNWATRSAYLRRSLASFNEHVSGPITQRVVYSDWGPAHLDELKAIATEHGFYVAGDGHHGYIKAVQRLWEYLGKRAVGDYIFLTEDDFLYNRDVDLMPMVETLKAHPKLAQVALLRAAYYPRELEAGSVLTSLKTETVPVAANGHSRIEHRDHWTMNPSLMRRAITSKPWPSQPSSERVFGDMLLRDEAVRFAYWGEGEPWVEHIGEVRAVAGGAGY